MESSSYRMIRLIFRTAAITEAVSWVGMLIAMLIKYPLQGSPLGVTIWGWVHGIAWLVFIVACILAAVRFRWAWWVVLIGLVTSVLPFLTVVFDVWMERTGRLTAPTGDQKAPGDRETATATLEATP